MYTDAFKSFTEQAEKSMDPMLKFNKLMAKNVELLTDLQMNAMRAYTDLGVAQVKAAAEIKDGPSLAEFNSSQLSTMAKISEQVSEDSKKLQDLAQELKSNLDDLVSENMNKDKKE